MLREIKVVRNHIGLYNIFVNGRRVMDMVGDYELADSIAYILSDPDGFIKEMMKEDL